MTRNRNRPYARCLALTPGGWGPASRRDAGFTLLEVLIAFIISGAAIAALMRAGASGLSATRTAFHYQEAVTLARSHLDVAVHAAALLPSDTQGDDGGFHWHIRVTPSATTAMQPHGTAQRLGPQVTLYAVTVWIAWRDDGASRDVRLDTEQISRNGP